MGYICISKVVILLCLFYFVLFNYPVLTAAILNIILYSYGNDPAMFKSDTSKAIHELEGWVFFHVGLCSVLVTLSCDHARKPFSGSDINPYPITIYLITLVWPANPGQPDLIRLAAHSDTSSTNGRYSETTLRQHIVAPELNDPICHSNECQIGSFSSEATI